MATERELLLIIRAQDKASKVLKDFAKAVEKLAPKKALQQKEAERKSLRNHRKEMARITALGKADRLITRRQVNLEAQAHKKAMKQIDAEAQAKKNATILAQKKELALVSEASKARVRAAQASETMAKNVVAGKVKVEKAGIKEIEKAQKESDKKLTILQKLRANASRAARSVSRVGNLIGSGGRIFRTAGGAGGLLSKTIASITLLGSILAGIFGPVGTMTVWAGGVVISLIVRGFEKILSVGLSVIGKLSSLVRGIVKIVSNVIGSILSSIGRFAGRIVGAVTSMISNLVRVVKLGVLVSGIAITAFVTKAILDFAKFEHETALIWALIREAGPSVFRDIKKQALDLSRTLSTEVIGAVQSLYDIVSAGFRQVSQAAQVAEAAIKIAKAGGATSVDATKAVISVLRAYSFEASRAMDVSDVLFRTVEFGRGTMQDLARHIGAVIGPAASFGFTMQDVGASIALLTNVLGPSSRTFTRVRRAMQAMIVPGTSAEAAMKRFGFVISKTDDGMVDLLKTLVEMRKKGFTQAQLKRMFPNIRSFEAVSIFLNRSTAELNKYFNAVRSSTGATETAWKKHITTLRFIWDSLVASIKRVGIEMAASFAPELKVIVGFMDDLAKSAERVVKQIKKMADAFAKGLGIGDIFGGEKARNEVEKSTKALGGLSAAFRSASNERRQAFRQPLFQPKEEKARREALGPLDTRATFSAFPEVAARKAASKAARLARSASFRRFASGVSPPRNAAKAAVETQKAAKGPFQKSLDALVDLFENAGTKIRAVFDAISTRISKFADTKLPEIIKKIDAAVSSFISDIEPRLDAFINDTLPVIVRWTEKILKGFESWGNFKKLVDEIKTSVLKMANEGIAKAVEKINEFVEAKTGIEGMGTAMGAVLAAAKDFATIGFPAWITALKETDWEQVGKDLRSLASVILNSLASAMAAVENSVAALRSAIEKILELMNKILIAFPKLNVFATILTALLKSATVRSGQTPIANALTEAAKAVKPDQSRTRETILKSIKDLQDPEAGLPAAGPGSRLLEALKDMGDRQAETANKARESATMQAEVARQVATQSETAQKETIKQQERTHEIIIEGKKIDIKLHEQARQKAEKFEAGMKALISEHSHSFAPVVKAAPDSKGIVKRIKEIEHALPSDLATFNRKQLMGLTAPEKPRVDPALLDANAFIRSEIDRTAIRDAAARAEVVKAIQEGTKVQSALIQGQQKTFQIIIDGRKANMRLSEQARLSMERFDREIEALKVGMAPDSEVSAIIPPLQVAPLGIQGAPDAALQTQMADNSAEQVQAQQAANDSINTATGEIVNNQRMSIEIDRRQSAEIAQLRATIAAMNTIQQGLLGVDKQ